MNTKLSFLTAVNNCDRPKKSGDAHALQRPRLCWPTIRTADQPVRRHLLISPGGVLFDDSMWSRWLLQLLSRMGLHTHPLVFLELWRRDYFDDVCFARRDLWESLQAMLIASGLSSGQADEVCAAARPRWRQWQASLHAFPQVATTLSALADAGVSLGVAACAPVSATCLATQLEGMGVARFFDFIVTSHDSGAGGSFVSLLAGAKQQWEFADEPAAIAFLSSRANEIAAARSADFDVIAAYASGDERLASIARFDELLPLAAAPLAPALAG